MPIPQDELFKARRHGKLNHYCRDVVNGFFIVAYEDGTHDWYPKGCEVPLNKPWKLIEIWNYDIAQREWTSIT